MPSLHTFVLAWLLAALPLAINAQNALRDEAPDTQLLSSDAFLRDHPDLRYRQQAEQAYARGEFERALRLYRSSARYADKTSQGRIAEMLWAGEGAPQDRALAYAWMDLAAERGYKLLLAIRERYWAQLTAVERERAVHEGQAIYTEYGDAVTKPRLEKALFKGRRSVTGSHAGFVSGNLTVTSVARGRASIGDALRDGNSFRGDRFYDKAYWEPEFYWAWQDKIFDAVPEGTVEVGDLRAEPEAAPLPER